MFTIFDPGRQDANLFDILIGLISNDHALSIDRSLVVLSYAMTLAINIKFVYQKCVSTVLILIFTTRANITNKFATLIFTIHLSSSIDTLFRTSGQLMLLHTHPVVPR